jgi:hypothetical protein
MFKWADGLPSAVVIVQPSLCCLMFLVILIIGSMATTIPSTKVFLFLFFCNLAFQDLRAFFAQP